MYREQKVTCHKIGTVFLTFTDQQTVREILNNYENNFLKIFFNKLISPFRNPPLLFRGSTIVATRAPGPR